MHFKREEDNFAMEMTPLIDVVFLLIIFFMVSTVFVDFSRRMDINLPSSKSSIIDEKPKTLEIKMSVSSTPVGTNSTKNMNEIREEVPNLLDVPVLYAGSPTA